MTERNKLTFRKDQNGFTAFKQFAGLFKCKARVFSVDWDLPCFSQNVPKNRYLKQVALCNEARHLGEDQWQENCICDIGVIDRNDLCAGWQGFQSLDLILEAEYSLVDLHN